MLGFSLQLYVLLGVELTLAGLLCLPLPISRPAVFIVKLSKDQVGRSIVGTIALFLVVLMASPVYDMYTLHQQKHKSAEGLLSQERRETEASSNLSLTLTGTCLALLLIIRTLGLSLAELDDLRTKYEPNGATETKAPIKKVA